MLKSGITKRWLLTTILVIALILLCVSSAVVVLIRDYYYDTVENKLQAMGQSSVLADYFGAYIGSSSDVFSSRAQEYVENFNDINVAEVWVLNKNGEVILTSTGFLNEDENVDEYDDALVSASGRAFWTGQISSGEKVMALTTMLPKTNNISNGAIRYIISLEAVDDQVVRIIILIAMIACFALFLVLASGMFFVRSIVVPVKQINTAARDIAAGHYSNEVVVSNKYDEIAELCESVNYMSREIDKTDRIKNDFISTVSHELRTPLTAIKGWTETLLSIGAGNEDKTVRDGLTVILSETERLYSLVEDLLDFSKMANNRLTLKLTQIDVLAELEEALVVLNDRASREGKTIEYSVPDFAAVMNADADRIKQVFVNIIDNALKYSNSGGVVNVIPELDGNSVNIVFEDNGCGIAADDLPHIKEKFFKANLSVKGSGIGLAVCDEIVRLHKGTLDITSTEGVGTTVTVTLPLANQYEV